MEIKEMIDMLGIHITLRQATMVVDVYHFHITLCLWQAKMLETSITEHGCS